MKKVKQFVLILLFLVLVQTIYAVETSVKVKTLPNHEVQVTLADSSEGGFSALYRYINDSDEYGDVFFDCNIEKDSFDVLIFVKKDGETVIKDKYLDYSSGEDVYIEIAPKWFELIETPNEEINELEEDILSSGVDVSVNLSDEATTEEEGADAESLAGVTGLVTSEGENFFSKNKTLFYIIGGFFGLFVVVLITSKVTRYSFAQKGEREIKVKKLSEMQKEKSERIDDYKGVIESAEKKIKEAQDEIRKLKKDDDSRMRQEKINSIKKRMIEDEKELMKLREKDSD